MYDPRHNISKFRDYLFPAVILITGTMISVAIFWNKNTVEKSMPSAILPIDISDKERVDIKINSGDPIIGNPKAPITIVEFYDFQCGYCKLFAQETLPKLIDGYVKSEKAKIIFKDFAILGEDSKSAAVAANCAYEQNKFLEFHDGLYSLKDENKTFSRENLFYLAQKLNLNVIKFNDCIGLSKNNDHVEQNTKQGKLSGVTGTPTIFVDGLKISGAQSFTMLSSIIDQELNK